MNNKEQDTELHSLEVPAAVLSGRILDQLCTLTWFCIIYK